MESLPRDGMAGLKLLGGLVRLDALCPDGFTAAQLADHARVDPETARAYLKSDKGPGYAEVIGGAKADADRPGRPANLYRLRPDRRTNLMQRLAEIRRELDAAAGLPARAPQPFAPLDLLEANISELECRHEPPEAWRARLAEARLELGGAEADLRALRSANTPDAESFAYLLQGLQGRLAAVERVGAPFTPPKEDPIRLLVDWLGGRWIGRPSAAIEPMLVLLDGIEGDNPMTNAIVMSCRAASVQIAAFDVAHMEAPQRADFWAKLDCLRMATPFAVSDLVLAVDGHTPIAHDLAAELCTLGNPGAWRTRVPGVAGSFSDLDLEALRRFYVCQSDVLLHGAVDQGHKVLATRLGSVLGMASMDAVESSPHLPFVDPKRDRERRQDAARILMGNIFCLDTVHSAAIEATFADAPVDYVAQAGDLPMMQTIATAANSKA